MGYVLQRVEDGLYVAPPGREHSYTTKLERARVFRTRAEAEGHACGNEHAVAVDDLVGSR